MSVIEISNLTKDYGHGRGIFDVSLNVKKGECFGFLGPNGAGKTTTIRHLMGFSKPQSGSAKIQSKDCRINAAELQQTIGYLPGEIALPTSITGDEFLQMQMKMKNVVDDSYCKMLCEKFEFNGEIETKRMSLGMKRKLAVIIAFLHDPDILILDEPTSGLDPVMQQVFIEYILSEKERGKTIFLSSHIFHEIDETCDRIAIIRDGVIVSQFVADEIKNRENKIYRVTFKELDGYKQFVNMPYDFTSKNEQKLRARAKVNDKDVNKFISDISQLDIADVHEIPFTLENYFMQFYKEDKVFEGVK